MACAEQIGSQFAGVVAEKGFPNTVVLALVGSSVLSGLVSVLRGSGKRKPRQSRTKIDAGLKAPSRVPRIKIISR